MASLAQALQHALKNHQQGRLAEAALIYRKILAKAPQHPQTLHLLGMLLQQQGDSQQARTLVGQALELAPEHAAFHASMGLICAASG